MTSLIEDVQVLLALAKRSRQRRMLRLCGTAAWLEQECLAALDVARCEDPHTLRAERLYAADGRSERARDRLGAELSALVIDGKRGIDADALGAALGMVKGAGLVIWLEDVERARTTFGLHLQRALDAAEGVITRSESGERLVKHASNEVLAEQTRIFEWGACTYDQERAVTALLGLLDRSAQPLLLSAHRGRGKSSALGLFVVAALARDSSLRIAVTAPSPRGTEVLMGRVRVLAPQQLGRVRVAAAVDLAQGKVDADLVLVDEAAGLSVELLSGILAHQPRVAFATTVHGYEGSGQGFRVRFMARLKHAYPRTREVLLEAPVRWEAGDPIEAFLARALVLDAPTALAVDAQGDDAWTGELGSITPHSLTRAQLLQDEALLRGVFGLFVLAHYRTTPTDLVHLLDDEGVRVWVVRDGAEVIAGLWAVEEGGFAAERARAVARGAERPRGQMLPEALARHLDEEDAAQGRGLRIVRIAVAPRARRSGVGRALLQALVTSARADGFDYVGAGFAATADVLTFWLTNDLSLVHIGTKRGAASGEVSALVMQGLSPSFIELTESLRARFLAELPERLRDGLDDLAPDVVACAWQSREDRAFFELSEPERRRLHNYLDYALPYESVVALLHRVVLARARSGAFQPLLESQALLIAKVLQGRSWPEIRRVFRFASVAEAMRAVRRALADECGASLSV